MATSLSRKILIGIFVLFLLSIFGLLGRISPLVVLLPERVFPDLELWRLITYPLAIEFLGMIVGSICFSAPGEEMEQMLGTRQFGALLLIVVISAALMHMALFFGSETQVLAGPANPALFMLVGFVYLFPHSEIRLLFVSIRSWVILAFVSAVILFWTIALAIQGASPLIFFSQGGFGLLLGIAYFHVRYQKYAVLLRPIRTVERMMSGGGGKQPAAMKPVATSSKRVASAPQPARIRIPFQKTPGRELSDEERLNVILDKIGELGVEGLSEEEKRFLDEYSNKL